jgi:hypothetical protein
MQVIIPREITTLGLPDISAEFPTETIYTYHFKSFQKFLKGKDPENIEKSLDMEIQTHGYVEEFFAYDKRNTEDFGEKPIISDYDHIKQDLIHSIFDDIWSELSPKFQIIIEKAKQDSNSKIESMETYANSISFSDENDDGFESETEENNMHLLRAMTIKPISLRKRAQLEGLRRYLKNNEANHT